MLMSIFKEQFKEKLQVCCEPRAPLQKEHSIDYDSVKLKFGQYFRALRLGRATSVAGINKESYSGRVFGLEAVLTYSDGTTETHYASFDAACTQAQYTSANIVPKEAGKTITSMKVSCMYGKNANT